MVKMINAPAKGASHNDVAGPPLSLGTLHQSLVESVTEYAIFALSPEGSIVSWNAGAESTFGWSRQEAIGTNYDIFFTPEDRDAGAARVELEEAEATGRASSERWHVRKNGTRFWATNILQPILDGRHKLVGFTKVVRDATERYEASELLRLSEERFRLLVESVSDYALISVSNDGDIMLWNRGAELLFGYASEEITGTKFAKLYTAEDARAGVPGAELAEAGTDGLATDERWQLRKDGSRFLASRQITQMALPALGGVSPGYVVILHDSTERKKLQDAIQHQALHDQLTGLPNRAMFFEHLKLAAARAKRHRDEYAVLFLDVDNFKLVNDSLGHIAADRLLRQLATRLHELVRAEDVVARLGGDEFAILITDLQTVQQAESLAQRLHAALAVPFHHDGREIVMTASVGISLGSADHKKPEDTLRDADIAMYAAKAGGRSGYMVFNKAMHTRVVALQHMESDLRRAVGRDELRILYQPIVELNTCRTVGFEALVRWQHPARGLLLPSEFLPTAVTSGTIVALDRWVLLNACKQFRTWEMLHPSADRLSLSVNLSSKQFMHDDLVAYVTKVLEDTKFDGARLKLEITEDTIMDRSERVIAIITQLRALGVKIYIDDFGTGYSSLSYLADLPVSMLKIDRSFVEKMTARPRSAGIVGTIVKLGRDLDLESTAEGIETTEQLSALRSLGCGYGQGYLFSRPVEWNVASELIGLQLGAA